MATAIAVETTDRLVKLLRLIFSTDKAGEIVAAVGAANRVLAAGDQDTHFIAEVFERGAALPIPRADHDHNHQHNGADDDDDRSAIWFCWHRRHRLSEKERLFVENVAARSSP